jgi:hypothetical protein
MSLAPWTASSTPNWENDLVSCEERAVELIAGTFRRFWQTGLGSPKRLIA